jgi:uncharacterized protein (TIGR02996 family)
MTTHDALLAAVRAAPEDDVPRLVYADYLADTGTPAEQARAEFIRLEIAAAQLPRDDVVREPLETRAAALHNQYAADWAEHLPEWVSWGDSAVAYDRGFVETLRTHPARFIDMPALWAVAPVRALHVRSRHVSIAPNFLFRIPAGLPIRRLKLGPFPEISGRSWLTAMTDAPDGLRETLDELDLSHNDIRGVELIDHIGGDNTTNLLGIVARLDLSDNRLSNVFAHRLAAARGFARLRHLDLRGNNLSGHALTVLRERFGAGVQV